MTYQLIVVPSAEREVERLDPPLIRRILLKIHDLVRTPRPFGSVKLQDTDTYRLRVGDYRIIYAVHDRSRQVLILRVRHRREAYR